jgi:hypothetical protein
MTYKNHDDDSMGFRRFSSVFVGRKSPQQSPQFFGRKLLKRVYQLIRPGTVFVLHSKKPNPRCPVGKRVQQGLLGHYRKAQAAKGDGLAQSTIVDVLHDVLAAGK